MARPAKEGLDYFPLDVDIDQDDKLVVPIGKFGMQGFGIIVRLMAEIYKNGYFYPWSEKEQYVFARRVNVDINLINEVIVECTIWGFFHQRMFDQHHVLTSKGFQKRYLEAAKRRKEITMIDQFVLVDPVDSCKRFKISISVVNADGIAVNEYINPDKSNAMFTETPQSKEKGNRKGKESKKDSKESNISPPPGKIQFADMVFLSQEEADKIISDEGQLEFDYWVAALSDYQVENKSRPSKIKSDHYRTILNWIRSDRRRKGQAGTRPTSKGPRVSARDMAEQLKREQEGERQ